MLGDEKEVLDRKKDRDGDTKGEKSIVKDVKRSICHQTVGAFIF